MSDLTSLDLSELGDDETNETDDEGELVLQLLISRFFEWPV